jgi:adenine-specific DNA-methyltransferase
MATSPSIQPLLCQPYERQVWQKLLQSLFPDGSLHLFSSPQKLAASQEKVKSTRQLGTIDLPDGNTIALLEVETTDQIKLARNRVGLRNFVSTFIDEAGASAVLAVFHQEKSEDWRLTYAARQTTLDEETSAIVTIETAPRRFTFVLGRNEPCRTAASRLATLLEKGDELSLTDVEKAFSVETLSKDFFKKYKEHYLAFVTCLLSPTRRAATRKTFGVPTLADEAEQDKADKPIRDFVKTLLGRLVFLHFLQKKGWLGCKAGSRAWTGGDPDFVQSLFSMAKSRKDAGHFHSKYLSALFFEALNMADRPGDIFPLTNTRLPYLNGGLFEEESAALRALDFPAELFANLLDFFSEYNFTIDENDPDDHEVGIDPEMLSHIFENLLEDNKDKGAFYTPKAIVSYMCRQSLLHYLQTHLGENKELEILLNEKDPTKHQGKDSFVAKHREKIIKLLEDVKICDPAIGSGAFPIGLLLEILWTLLTLQPELNTPTERARLKRQIIQNSIHGVDIDPGAIEIARLRFWLALVVDEDEPRPLPNLDYKIHRADSLIEYIRGESVNLGTEAPKDAAAKAAVEKLIAAKQSLFTAQGMKEKRSAWFDLYRALAQLAQAEFTWMRNGTNFADGERLSQLTRGIKEFGQWIGQIDAIKKEKAQLQDSLLGKLRHWFDDPTKPTFLWNLHFGEILANGGFDVVIANPPYHAETGMKDVFRAIREGTLSNFYRGKMDLFYFFIHLGIRLAKDRGTLTFITTNYYLTATYADKLRHDIKESTNILGLINFGEYKIFDSALGQHNAILQLRKTKIKKEDHNARVIVVSDPTKPSYYRLVSILNGGDSSSKVLRKKHSELFHKQSGYIIIEENDAKKILERIESKSKPLRELYEVCKGVEAGLNSVYVMKEIPASLRNMNHIEKKLIVPFWKNSQVRRWCIHPSVNKLLYIQPEDNIKELPKIGSYLEQHKKQLSSRAQIVRSKSSKWHALLWPRNEGLFRKGKKLVTSYRPSRLSFALADGEFFSGTDTYLVHGNSSICPLESLLAIINSKSIEYWLRCRSKVKGSVIELTGDSIEKIPIPSVPASEKLRLSKLAEACAAAARRNDTASLTTLESEINTIVYRLFGLTSEEIALIEASIPN